MDLGSAVELMKETEDKEFPIAGVRAAREYHEAVAGGPSNFLSYHAEWPPFASMEASASLSCFNNRETISAFSDCVPDLAATERLDHNMK